MNIARGTYQMPLRAGQLAKVFMDKSCTEQESLVGTTASPVVPAH